MDAGIRTPDATSSTWALASGHVVASLDGQFRSPVRESSALVSVGTDQAARGSGSQNSPQSLVAVCPTLFPSPGVGEGQLQGLSPLCSSEVQVGVEEVQRVGELIAGSGVEGDKLFLEQKKSN